LALALHADIVTLKNGRIINGTYVGGTPRQIKVEVGEEIETIDVSDISRIEFGSGGGSGGASARGDSRSDDGRPTLRRTGSNSSGSAPGPIAGPSSPPVMVNPDPSDPRTQTGSGGGGFGSDKPTLRRSTGSSSDTSSSQSDDPNRPTLRRAGGSSSDAPASTAQGDDANRPTLRRAPGSASDSTAAGAQPAGSAASAPAAAPMKIPAPLSIVVRLIDSIDSAKAKEGDTFAASLDQPIAVDGQVVVPAGTDMTVKLVQAQQSGKFTGKTELTVSLWSMKLNGKTIEIDTQNITEASASRGAKTAKVAGGAAAVGAVIGAVAGGGKGAAIGAGAGAAGGAAVQAATRGEHVKIASETLLTFMLEKPIAL
jgi:hypothetical protein